MVICPECEGTREMRYEGEWYFAPTDFVTEFYACHHSGSIYARVGERLIGPLTFDKYRNPDEILISGKWVDFDEFWQNRKEAK